jgi:enoyl-CoA hydratase/carnithine racemase
MSANPVLWNLDARGVATVTLNRPEVNNAYDAGLIGGVLAAMDDLGSKPNLRLVVLKGNGKHFQAGADLKWINGVRPKSTGEKRGGVARDVRGGCSGSIRCRSRRWRWCRAAASAAAPA